jgi:hypothetical protein
MSTATAIQKTEATVQKQAHTDQIARRILGAMHGAMSDLVAACKLYADELKKDPALRAAIQALAPEYHIPRGFLLKLEMIGAGIWHPQLLQEPSPLLRRLNIDDQRRILEDGVPVATCATTGEHRLLRWSTMTTDQRRQVVADGELRDIESQTVYLRNVEQPAPPIDKNALPYFWDGKKLHFHAGYTANAAEVMRILASGVSRQELIRLVSEM